MLSFDHIALPIYDAGATLTFYTEVLGLPLVDALSGGDWGGKPWLMLIFALGDGRQLALVRFKGTERPPGGELPADAPHYAMSAASARELGNWRQRLEAAGVPFTLEDHGTQKSIYFEDPNGITLEITAPPSQAEPRNSASAVGHVAAWIKESGS